MEFFKNLKKIEKKIAPRGNRTRGSERSPKINIDHYTKGILIPCPIKNPIILVLLIKFMGNVIKPDITNIANVV